MTANEDNPAFEALLDYLKRTRNFDFKAYKRTTLMRRIERRMQALSISEFADYQDYLQRNPDEFVQLFNTLLINVTSFFRDGAPWEYVESELIPQLLDTKHPHDPIRVWSAGCASGQEAYTLVMLMTETMGPESFRSRVKVYATDIDDDALMIGRHGIYSPKDVTGVPAAFLEKYFETHDGRYIFRKDLRRCVIFGRHDLLQDAPISRVDLIVCRNTLMYFNNAAQARILARFHFALNDGGYLFLGRAETLMSHASTFTPVDMKRRVFVKTPAIRLQNRPMLVPRDDDVPHGPPTAATDHATREAALDASGVAQLVIDREGTLALANSHARGLFGLLLSDVGRPFQDLDISYRPVELRSLLDQAYATRRPVVIPGIEWPSSTGEGRWLDVRIVPLTNATSVVVGMSVTFVDVTANKKLQQQLEHSNIELESAYEQLQSTNEELETTNEELQSTVEELETTNEELQATNEELETMNEELQSTNEELHAINDIARQYTTELDRANMFLESIFSGLGHRVIVVDPDQKVILWNSGSEDLWGLRSSEVMGSRLAELDCGIPAEALQGIIASTVDGDPKVTHVRLEATNRRGKRVNLDFKVAPLLPVDGNGIGGAILLIEDAKPKAD